MKKLIMIIAIVLTGSVIATAGNGNKINSVLSKHLQIPSQLKSEKLNEKVNVQFKIDTKGKATVMNVETKNPDLKHYITEQLPKIDFNDVNDKPEEIYFVDINFKVL